MCCLAPVLELVARVADVTPLPPCLFLMPLLVLPTFHLRHSKFQHHR
ncbi:hypothetical protein MtrunA17_Chr6g0472591 [Medicago truncatula]|uniref:Transmembrane protein n=1 Tax=Medicago truncatula TaxID=3880 RepID=A0A396HEM7_MEDTR|nr:hypothetical protein MtrunA17_Chr6g0472591 [Medicago truncatula]